MHHWAHRKQRNCDPWWENETPWHRAWKNRFPPSCREISHTAPDGEIHRADIKTPTGIVIEVQHSDMTDAERLSRESFYGNLVWVIDGNAFRQNFNICHMLPDPASEVAQGIIWTRVSTKARSAACGMFFRLSDTPGLTKTTLKNDELYLLHGMREIEGEVNEAYSGHHQYHWRRPRATWLESKCPVYLDFGDEHLCKLEIYDESALPCVRLVAKEKFVHDAMTENLATSIATRFYPIALPSNQPIAP